MLIHEKKLNDADYECLISEVREKMKDALPQKQWAMNRCLCEIGIRHVHFTYLCI
ncbi:MAG: hypothetical protein K0R21_1779 [Anaerocolumna sp.]|jgi:hypothetical protein|nr:hypothetical protein [Anaerocolumna sp.]